MNSYLWLVVVLVVTATAGGLYGKGRSDGREACETRYAELQQEDAARQAQVAAAYETERQRLKAVNDNLTETRNALIARDPAADCKLSRAGVFHWNRKTEATGKPAD